MDLLSTVFVQGYLTYCALHFAQQLDVTTTKTETCYEPRSEGDKIQFQIFFRVVFQQLKKCRIFLAASKMFFQQAESDLFQKNWRCLSKMRNHVDNQLQTCYVRVLFRRDSHKQTSKRKPKDSSSHKLKWEKSMKQFISMIRKHTSLAWPSIDKGHVNLKSKEKNKNQMATSFSSFPSVLKHRYFKILQIYIIK